MYFRSSLIDDDCVHNDFSYFVKLVIKEQTNNMYILHDSQKPNTAILVHGTLYSCVSTQSDWYKWENIIYQVITKCLHQI